MSRKIPWALRNKDKVKKYAKRKNLKRTYGLSLEEFEAKKLLQKNLCAICRRPETGKIKNTVKELSVDHNHKTKQIRGLLCQDCNRALGMFKEDILILQSAIQYLEEFDARS